MEKVCPWCGQPSDRGLLKTRTVLFDVVSDFAYFLIINANNCDVGLLV